MAAIQPEIIELKEKYSKLEELYQKLEARMLAVEKTATWWRLFSATALPIILALFIATWAQNGRFADMNARFDDMSKRMDRIEQRMDRIEQRMDRVEQTNQQILKELHELRAGKR